MPHDPLRDAQQSLVQAIDATRRAKNYYDYLKADDKVRVALTRITDELCVAHAEITALVNA
jgi:hypothetical protein